MSAFTDRFEVQVLVAVLAELLLSHSKNSAQLQKTHANQRGYALAMLVW